MKVFIVLSALVVAVSAGGYGGGGNGGSYGAGGSSGSSNVFRHDDNYGNYQFGYDESHSTGGSSRREEETNGVRRGSYSLSDADGRRRTVNYVADAAGFRATIDTNEPGTESKSPADVIMNGAQQAHGGAVAQGSSYSAPAPVATYTQMAAPRYSAPAPVSYSAPARMSYGYSAPRQQQQQQQQYTTSYSAPIAQMRTYSAPAPMRAYSAPAQASYSAGPAQNYYSAQAIEAPTPRAFSYSFGTSHPAMSSYGNGAASYGAGQASYGTGATSYGTGQASYGQAAPAATYQRQQSAY